MSKTNGVLRKSNWPFKTGGSGAATPRSRSTEPFDSTKIDRDHQAFAKLGYRFITNVGNSDEEKAQAKKWVEKNYGQETAYLIHDNAYALDGRRLSDCASVWIKQAKK